MFTDAGPKFSTRVKPIIDPFKMKTKPGPGLYDPEKPKTSIGYSMRKKPDSASKYMTPGPGAYGDPREQHYKTLPGSKIGKDQRKSNHFLHNSSYKKQDPGRYSLHSFASNDLMGVPKYSFSKDQRDKMRKTTHPGPTSYNIGTKISDGVASYSMPGRRKDLRPKLGVGVPGAGAYDPEVSPVKKNGPLFSVSKSKRDGELKIFKNTPGAGHYGDTAQKVVRAKSASWR